MIYRIRNGFFCGESVPWSGVFMSEIFALDFVLLFNHYCFNGPFKIFVDVLILRSRLCII